MCPRHRLREAVRWEIASPETYVKHGQSSSQNIDWPSMHEVGHTLFHRGSVAFRGCLISVIHVFFHYPLCSCHFFSLFTKRILGVKVTAHVQSLYSIEDTVRKKHGTEYRVKAGVLLGTHVEMASCFLPVLTLHRLLCQRGQSATLGVSLGYQP